MRQWFNNISWQGALDYLLHRGRGSPDALEALPLGHKVQR